jgi:hypothetical protein
MAALVIHVYTSSSYTDNFEGVEGLPCLPLCLLERSCQIVVAVFQVGGKTVAVCSALIETIQQSF